MEVEGVQQALQLNDLFKDHAMKEDFKQFESGLYAVLDQVTRLLTQQMLQLDLTSKQQEIAEITKVLEDKSLNSLATRLTRPALQKIEINVVDLTNMMILTEHVEVFKTIENLRLFEVDPTGSYLLACADKLLKINLLDKRSVELVPLKVQGVCWTPDGNCFFFQDEKLYSLDTATGAYLHIATFDNTLVKGLSSTETGEIIITKFDFGRVYIYNLETKNKRKVAGGYNVNRCMDCPHAPCSRQGHLFFLDQQNKRVTEWYDERTFKYSFEGEDKPGCLKYNPKKDVFYLTFPEQKKLVTYKIEGELIDKEKVLNTVALPQKPGWMSIDPVSQHLYIHFETKKAIVRYTRV